MSKNKLNIGFYVSNFNDESVRVMCSGAARAALDLDANLVIFPGMHLNANFNDLINPPYYYQYNTIYSLGNKQNLDLLIIHTGNIGNTLKNEQIKTFLDNYKGIPVMTIATEHEGYSSVKFDNRTGLNRALSHLINRHNCRKIGFVSGSKFNSDARERLEVYCDTLMENNLPVDHNLIAYGNFSEFCEHEVTELLNENPDIDAICFANDEMAKGGYKAIEHSGKKIGKDIAVISFDNTSTSVNLQPSLTSVAADSFRMGYTAVKTMAETDGKEEVHITIPTHLIVRNSCGCRNTALERMSYIFGSDSNDRSELLSCTSDDFSDYLFGNSDNRISDHICTAEKLEIIKIKTKYFLDTVLNSTLASDRESYLKAVSETGSEAIASGLMSSVPHDAVFNVLDAVYSKISSDSSFSEECSYIMNQIYRAFSERAIIDSHLENSFIEYNTSVISAITNEVIVTEESDTKAFFPAMKRMASLGFIRSYLLIYETSVNHDENQKWIQPEKIRLKFSQELDNIRYFKEGPLLEIGSLFSSKQIKPCTEGSMIISPLFSNNEMYGLLLCEAKPELYRYINNIVIQMSTALRYSSVLNDLYSTLESEKENSKNFEKISKHDELTGIYNRRGYYDTAQAIITNPVNEGKRAIVVFADMDNLKIINDRFGHDDGDYSLRSIAEILVRSFRTTDIIGRIGGDEFAVFALMNNSDNIEIIKNRIRATNDKFNRECTKPYYVNISVGIYSFTCGKTVVLSEILENADTLLYQQKKEKRKSVIKGE